MGGTEFSAEKKFREIYRKKKMKISEKRSKTGFV